MKEIEKINELRKLIPQISLSQAIKLIEEQKEVSLAVEKFHQKNIQIIGRLSECYDDEKVEKYYKICHYNIEETIKKIHSELFFLTTRPDTSLGLEKIGFVLWEENNNPTNYPYSRGGSLFIPSVDFNYVIDAFKSVFPIKNTNNSQTEESFDICGHNYFSNETCKLIVRKIAEIETDNPNVETFIRDLIKWFNVRLSYAQQIVVYGNL